MKDKILKEMESYFGDDQKRINHAKRVLGYAEKIMEKEGGDPDIIYASAILHDIGIHAAGKKYGSTAGKYQEIEGPAIAEHLLAGIGFPADKVFEVKEIIGSHHTPGKINTINFKVIYDADWLVNLGDECNLSDEKRVKNAIDRIFLTQAGKNLAAETYLKNK
ncbi:HD domain-containing protein [Candidatus Saganbacteria bacterium]|nr:HD domain-containing protein [Candidatus Saganbacteria bacterium]